MTPVQSRSGPHDGAEPDRFSGSVRPVWNGAEGLRRLLVPIASLEPWPGNPRRGDVAAVAASLRRFGQVKPVVVDGARIVAGHHVIEAARSERWTHVAALDHRFGSEQEARAFLLADNRTGELGSFDEALLLEQLRTFDEAALLDGTGYDEAFRATLERELAPARALADDAPPLPTGEPDSQRGHVYELGPHRLLCGDAASVADTRRLVGTHGPVEAIWTDPPYGVEYVGKTKAALTISGDKVGAAALAADALSIAVAEVLAPGGRVYCAAPGGKAVPDFCAAFVAAGLRLHQTLVWVKDTFVLGHSDYHFAHELILYGHAPGGRPHRGGRGGSRWSGGHNRSSVFAVPRPKRSVEHPTMKPVELIAAQLANSVRPGDTVYEPFAGSGSTLIACDKLGLRCLAMEVDPRFCDVVRQRYAEYANRPDLAPSSGERDLQTKEEKT